MIISRALQAAINEESRRRSDQHAIFAGRTRQSSSRRPGDSIAFSG
jgi:hypothetical protein